MRRRKPTPLGAMMVWMVATLAIAAIVGQVYAPAAPFIGVPGGLACAVAYFIWRYDRYKRWLRGDDVLSHARSTAARSS